MHGRAHMRDCSGPCGGVDGLSCRAISSARSSIAMAEWAPPPPPRPLGESSPENDESSCRGAESEIGLQNMSQYLLLEVSRS